MLQGQALPAEAVAKIRSFDGNGRCMDCRSPEPDWADVSHGTVVCIQCAGRHRALGVQTSFVRSLTMDNWNEENVLAMTFGGNAQLRGFFTRQHIENSDIEMLYTTKQAKYYREQLRRQVRKVLDERHPSTAKAKSKRPKAQPASKPRAARASGGARTRPPARAPTVTAEFEVTFRHGTMGLSITRAMPPPGVAPNPNGNGSTALITRTTADGVAAVCGVRLGDYVTEINGRRVADYDELMAFIASAGRPVVLKFRRYSDSGPSRPPRAEQHSAARAEGDRQRPPISPIAPCQASAPSTTDSESDESTQSDAESEATSEDGAMVAPREAAAASAPQGDAGSEKPAGAAEGEAVGLAADAAAADGVPERVLSEPATEARDVVEEDGTAPDTSAPREPSPEARAPEPETPSPAAAADDADGADQSAGRPAIPETPESDAVETQARASSPNERVFEPGERVRVYSPRANKWRKALVSRYHGDGSLKVEYLDDGSTEKHVARDRVRAKGATGAHKERSRAQPSPREEDATPTLDHGDFSVTFGEGSLGLSLEREADGLARVMRLVPGGAAARGGVAVGDTVRLLARQPVSGYDQIMALLPQLARPLEISFTRRHAASGSSVLVVSGAQAAAAGVSPWMLRTPGASAVSAHPEDSASPPNGATFGVSNAPAVVVSSIGARKNTAPIAGNFGASYSQKLAAAGLASKAAPPARTLAPTPGSMSTRVALAESGDSDQFDVTFDSG